MILDDELHPSLFESLNLACAIASIFAIGFVGSRVVKLVDMTQNNVLKVIINAGQRYERFRHGVNKELDEFNRRMIVFGGDV